MIVYWVSVEDSLPERVGNSDLSTYVLVAFEGGGTWIGMYNYRREIWLEDEEDCFSGREVSEPVTHWMTIPNPPGE